MKRTAQFDAGLVKNRVLDEACCILRFRDTREFPAILQMNVDAVSEMIKPSSPRSHD